MDIGCVGLPLLIEFEEIDGKKWKMFYYYDPERRVLYTNDGFRITDYGYSGEFEPLLLRFDVDNLSATIYKVSKKAPREAVELFNKLLLDPPVSESELRRLILLIEKRASSKRGGIVRISVPNANIKIYDVYELLRELGFGDDLVLSLIRNALARVEKGNTLYLLFVTFTGYKHIEGISTVDRVALVSVYSVDKRMFRLENAIVTYESILNAVKDMLIEDFRNGDFHLKNLDFVTNWVPIGFLGFEEVAREVYRMRREGRVYGRVEVVDDLGRRVTYHLIVPPETGGVLYVVEAGGKLYVTEVGGLSDVKPKRVEDFERAEKRSMDMPEYRDALEDMEKEVLDRYPHLLPDNVLDLLLERAAARALERVVLGL